MKAKRSTSRIRSRTSSTKRISEAIRVGVRVRPLIGDEINQESSLEVIYDDHKLRVVSSQHDRTIECGFDHVLAHSAQQSDVYAFVQPAVSKVLEGYNATIFAYGQTGTGKTYSMVGKSDEGTTENTQHWGVMPRAVTEIFNTITKRKDTGFADVVVKCSYIEIYNEKIYDLLVDKRRSKQLVLREQSPNDTTNVHIQGLSSVIVHNTEEVLILLRRGRSNRTVRDTEYNSESSRSHAILQIQITTKQAIAPTTTDCTNEKQSDVGCLSRTAKLNMVDLAGSEKWNTHVDMENAHELELRNINTSLSALGNCIAALNEPGRKHIPYRDSTLTRLLQDSFGGNTFTVMLATISMSSDCTEETIRTLLFADRAKSVMQRISINEAVVGNSELVVARGEIQILQQELARLRNAKAKELREDKKQSLEEIVQKFDQDISLKQSLIDTLEEENSKYLQEIRSSESKISQLEQLVSELNREKQKRDQERLVNEAKLENSRRIESRIESLGSMDSISSYRSISPPAVQFSAMPSPAELISSSVLQLPQPAPEVVVKSHAASPHDHETKHGPPSPQVAGTVSLSMSSYQSTTDTRESPLQSLENSSSHHQETEDPPGIEDIRPTSEALMSQHQSITNRKPDGFGDSLEDGPKYSGGWNSSDMSQQTPESEELHSDKELEVDRVASGGSLGFNMSRPASGALSDQKQEMSPKYIPKPNPFKLNNSFQLQRSSPLEVHPDDYAATSPQKQQSLSLSPWKPTRIAPRLAKDRPEAQTGMPCPITIPEKSVNVSSLGACSRHNLAGCVLCTLKKSDAPELVSPARVSPLPPAFSPGRLIPGFIPSTTSLAATSPIVNKSQVMVKLKMFEKRSLCSKHNLSACILCERAATQSQSTAATAAPSFPFMNTAHRSPNFDLSQPEVSKPVEDSPCSRHSLRRCILCKNNSSMNMQTKFPSIAPSLKLTFDTKFNSLQKPREKVTLPEPLASNSSLENETTEQVPLHIADEREEDAGALPEVKANQSDDDIAQAEASSCPKKMKSVPKKKTKKGEHSPIQVRQMRRKQLAAKQKNEEKNLARKALMAANMEMSIRRR